MISHVRIFITSFVHKLWTLFLSGLIALLPMTLTIAVFTLTFRLVKGWLEPLKQFEIPFLATTPYSEFILALCIILVAGMLYNIFILRPIVHAVENLVMRLPLVRPVYTGIKKLVEAFSPQDNVSFTNVVMIEFPRTGMYSVGFLANQFNAANIVDMSDKYFSIFIPTTPNPTSGFFVIVPEKDIIFLDMTRQEAMSMIMSGGIIQPDSITKKNQSS